MPIVVAFFVSGAAALILQVLWTRMLGHVFGATTLAVSTTVGVFMLGLAIGSAVAGRFAHRLRHPFLWFAALETGVGLYGLAVPGLLGLLPEVQAWVGEDLGFLEYTAFRLVMSIAVLILPTTAMGATLPILAEGVVRRGEGISARTGRLYAANTLGAVVGAALAGFVLIPDLGLEETVRIAAAADLFVAAIVVALWRVGRGDRILVAERTRALSADDALFRIEPDLARLDPIGDRTRRLVLVVFGLSGAAAMALEVLFTRAIGVVIGASTYSFTLILTTFLAGLAIGSALMTRVVERVTVPLAWLASAEMAVGAAAILATLVIDRLPLLLHGTTGALSTTTTALYLTSLLIISVVTLPATLALGAVFPLVVRIIASGREENAGSIVGQAYVSNTLGAIVGSFGAGFVVLPLLGVERGLVALALFHVALGGTVALTRDTGRMRFVVTGTAIALLAAVSPSWDVGRWTAGLFRIHVARNVHPRAWRPTTKVVYHRDGVATSVTVDAERDGSGVSLKVNGKVDASDVGDMPTQVLSGLLPLLLHPSAKDVLVIGYGSGVTSGAVLTAPVESLSVAEIEARVYEAANLHFAHVNGRPFEDPRARLHVDDGRNFLLTRRGTYDVIISEPSNPWMSGAASLFTVDFFRIAARRLRPSGLFLQWLQLYELSTSNVAALLRTFHAVFPFVLVFTPDPRSNDTLLIGSMEPVIAERSRLEAMMAIEEVADDLRRAHVTRPHDLLALFLLGNDGFTGPLTTGPLNTDDNALLEFGAPRDLLTYASGDAELPFLEGIDGRRLALGPRHFSGFDFGRSDLLEFAESLLAFGLFEDARAFADEAVTHGLDAGRIHRLIDYATEADDEPVVVVSERTRGDRRYARVILAVAEEREEDALVAFEREKGMERESPEHAFLYAYLLYRNGRPRKADELITGVLGDDGFSTANPAVVYYAAKIALARGHGLRAIALFDRFDRARETEGTDDVARSVRPESRPD